MFHNLRVQNKLYAGIVAILALFLLLLVTAYNNFTSLVDANRWDRHTLEVLTAASRLESTSYEIRSEYRGYLLTGDEAFVARLPESETELRGHMRKLHELTADNPLQLERVAKIENMIDAWLKTIVHPMVDKRRALGQGTSAAEQIARDPLMTHVLHHVEDMRSTLDEFEKEENRLLATRTTTVEALRNTTSNVLIGGSTLAVVIALVLAYVLSRSILRPIDNLTNAVTQIAGGNQSARAEVLGQDEIGQVTAQFNRMADTIQQSRLREQQLADDLRAKVDSILAVVLKAASGDLTGRITVSGNDAIGRLGEGLATMFDNLRVLLNRVQKAGIQVATSTTEIAASARQQEATGVEQAQTSIEVLSTTKEISANTSQLLKAMEDVTRVAEYTATTTGEAQGSLKRMDLTMQHMVSATDSINAKLAALSEKASNINNVLTTITKVADQTNILSLNAAIEAEKAGEAGRGSSVVATEIRRLSDQTSVATWDIEQMLKEMQSAVSASVMGMDKFSEEIRRSVDEVREVAAQLNNVIDQVQKLTPRFDLVLEGMQSQAVGASQITETMTQLNEATQQAVDALRSTSEAVQQLQYAAQDLQAGVSNFAVNM
jgi:methyl-accepting chemotaxis protein WspA